METVEGLKDHDEALLLISAFCITRISSYPVQFRWLAILRIMLIHSYSL